jgi:hypothetical protein
MCNEAEMSSLALRLTRSPCEASRAPLLDTRARSDLSNGQLQDWTFHPTRSTRLGLARQITLQSENETAGKPTKSAAIEWEYFSIFYGMEMAGTVTERYLGSHNVFHKCLSHITQPFTAEAPQIAEEAQRKYQKAFLLFFSTESSRSPRLYGE